MNKIGPTTPIAAGQVKKGMYALLKNSPCKILSVSIHKTGKHGHAKANFHGIDVFTEKKYDDNHPTTHTMLQPILTNDEYDLLDIDYDEYDSIGIGNDYLSLMTIDGIMKEDIRLPDNELGKEIQKHFNDKDKEVSVTVLAWGDAEEAIISYKLCQ